MHSAEAVIAALGLSPHPEGGWFREMFRAPTGDEVRSRVTAIYFLLEAGRESHWHRVDADEVWCWHAGDVLELGMAEGDLGAVSWARVGGDVLAGEAAQVVVPKGWWQAARAGSGWALVSCVVAPGFDFSGFEMADLGWAPGGGPLR